MNSKEFNIKYRPFPMSDLTQTTLVFGVDEADAREHFNKYFVGEIVSVEEAG